MTELAKRAEANVSVLDGLAAQARTLRLNINVNMWQLARVFVEAKDLVPHGEWGQWLQENADVSVRTAEDMMAAYRRFGGKAPFQTLSPSQTFRLLPLPEGSEDRFAEEHDIQSMTTRQIQEAVKQARAEMQAQIAEAERRARLAEAREPEIPEEMYQQIEEHKAEAQHFAELARNAANDKARLEKENRRLKADLDDAEQSIAEQQEALDKAQGELLNYQSERMRGDAEHEPVDELTIEAFSAAVRSFIGTCARMPYMTGTFAGMDTSSRTRYDELLKTVEGWCAMSRKALCSEVTYLAD